VRKGTCHTDSELAALETATGLNFAGYLQVDGLLLPVFLKERSRAALRAIVLRLNGRDTGQQAA
jgi:hypothetical protein